MPPNPPADLALFEQVQATVKKAVFQLIIDKQDTAVAHHQYAWDDDIYIDYWTVNTLGASKFIYQRAPTPRPEKSVQPQRSWLKRSSPRLARVYLGLRCRNRPPTA
jgi:hypothetical protein